MDPSAPDAVDTVRESILDEMRDGLVSGAVDGESKVEILKHLIQMSSPRTRSILASAAACSLNAPILKHIVRAFGFIGDRSAIADLVPFLAHENRSVVCNALKSVIDLDQSQAVMLAKRIVKNVRTQVAWPVALVLSRTCEPECREFFLGLTYSGRSRDRLSALIYLRTRPPEESVPVIMDMIRREKAADVRTPLMRLLARRIPKRRAALLVELRTELQAKVAEIDGMLSCLPEELDPSWVAPSGSPLSGPPVRPAAGAEPGAAIAAEKGEGRPLVVDAAPAVQAGPIVQEPQAAPAPALVPVPAPVPIQPVLPLRDAVIQPAGGPQGSRHGLVALGIAAVSLVVGVGISLRHEAPTPPRPSPVAVRSVAPHPLGPPGSEVNLGGRIVQVQREASCVLIETDKGIKVLVHVTDCDLGKLVPQRDVDVKGIVKPIKLDGAFVVEGLSLRQL